MAVPATISLTEAQCFEVLGDFITAMLPAEVEVEQGQVNRVPQPIGPNFVIMSPLRRTRLGTNETTYSDTVFTASITGDELDVTAVAFPSGPGIAPGMQITDGVYPNLVAPSTAVVEQTGGAPGGVGTYTVAPAQSVASETMYADQRADLAETEFVVQVDVYGPMAGDNAQVISTTFRSEVASAFFEGANPAVSPLTADEPTQAAFNDAESQYENRWTLQVRLQVNPVVGTPQQVFTSAEVALVDVTP